MKHWIAPLTNWKLWLVPSLASVLLVAIAQYSYLAFHTFAELIAIVISFLMFTCAWATRKHSPTYYLLCLACGYFWVGYLDLIHTLVYKGMNVIVEGTGNLGVQFWISARYLEAMLLFVAPLIADRQQNAERIFYSYAVLSICFTTLIFGGQFPVGFVEGYGLTPFKIVAEYVINIILVLSVWTLFKFERTTSPDEKKVILLSILTTVLSEMAFTFYEDVYGYLNLIGHIFKLFSFWFIFYAIILSNLKQPYAILKQSEARFKQIFENSEVAILDVDISEALLHLQALRSREIQSLRQYLESHPTALIEIISKIKISDVNTATLKLFGTTCKLQIQQGLYSMPSEPAIAIFKDALCAIWSNEINFRAEVSFRTLDDDEIDVLLSFPIPERFQDNGNIPVSLIDITQRKRNEAVIFHQANFDLLTDLPNRHFFVDRVNFEIERATTNSREITLLYLDIDGFKHINDSLGHEFGDELLKQVSQRLLHLVKPTDMVARLGGDEFAVLVLGENDEQLRTLIRGILDDLSQPYLLKDVQVYVTVSIGGTVFPRDGQSAIDLLRKADSAMYKVKSIGGRNFQFCTPQMDEVVQQRQILGNALRQAMEHKQEFYLTYQPIIDLKSGRVANAEVLLRWQHPELGLISPDLFIPLAEELGLISDLTVWILETACRDAKVWGIDNAEMPGISVNLSSVQFKRQNVASWVTSLLVETRFPPEKLTLEITESLMMDNYLSRSQLHAIRQTGISLSVDDFGTGYSSLSYLKRFPVTSLKIDRTFIMDLPYNSEDRALVSAILSMAQSLHLKVVAEGVETLEQLQFLRDRNCDCIQGYFYSQPLVIRDFLKYLKQYPGRSS